MLKLELTTTWQNIGNTELEVQISSNSKCRLFYGLTAPIEDKDGFVIQLISSEFKTLKAPSEGFIWIKKMEDEDTAYIKYRECSSSVEVPSSVKNILTDNLGNEVEVGAFGGLKVTNASPQISVTFDHPLTVRDFKLTGTPQAQVNRSLLEVSNGDVVETVDTLRYKTAQTIETYFTAEFDGTYTVGTSYIGLFDISDGVFVGYKDSDFVVGYRNIYADGGVGNEPDVLQVVTEPTNVDTLTRYRIKFGYLGSGNPSFEYFDGVDWILLHQFKTDNELNRRTHIGSPILPMRSECNHSGCSILSGSWNASTLGAISGLQDVAFFEDGEREVAGNTIPQPVVAFRSKSTFGGFPSKVKSQLLEAEFATGSEGLYKFEMYKFPQGTLNTGTWTDIDVDSVMEKNQTFTNTIAGGEKMFTKTIAVASQGTGVGVATTDFKVLGVKASAGDEFAVFKRELIGGGGDDITSWAFAFVDLL